MNTKDHRVQYLIGTAAGATCLALSLLAYQMEGAFLRLGWIHERSTGAFLLLFMAVLMLFLGSIQHAKMLFARLSPGAPERQIEPVRTGLVVTWTVLVTLVVASECELHSLCLEGDSAPGNTLAMVHDRDKLLAQAEHQLDILRNQLRTESSTDVTGESGLELDQAWQENERTLLELEAARQQIDALKAELATANNNLELVAAGSVEQ